MVENFAFGDFVFRTAGRRRGRPRAAICKSLEEKLRTVPAESIALPRRAQPLLELVHGAHRVRARAQAAAAARSSEFATLEDLRHDLIALDRRVPPRAERDAGRGLRRARPSTRAAATSPASAAGRWEGRRAGSRSCATCSTTTASATASRASGSRVPPAVVLATDCFDRFLAENELLDLALDSRDDDEILRRFLAAPLPARRGRGPRARSSRRSAAPLAVRSSSLLEDSQYQPFTGVYETFMLAEQPPRPARAARRQLMSAIKRVYASTFRRRPRTTCTRRPTASRRRRWRWSLQQVVGARHGTRFYPDFSGVARSHNFYPTPPLASEDGVAAVALGMGRTVVDGERCLALLARATRRRSVQLLHRGGRRSSNSQREFWALELERATGAGSERGDARDALRPRGRRAGRHAAAVGSTYSAENQAIYDGLARPGVRLVTFAPMLKHGVFPLAEILSLLLDVGQPGHEPARPRSSSRRCISRDRGRAARVRIPPDAAARARARDGELDLDEVAARGPALPEPAVHRERRGRRDLRDVVVVDVHRFDRVTEPRRGRARSRASTRSSGGRGRPYLLDRRGPLGLHRSVARHSGHAGIRSPARG